MSGIIISYPPRPCQGFSRPLNAEMRVSFLPSNRGRGGPLVVRALARPAGRHSCLPAGRAWAGEVAAPHQRAKARTTNGPPLQNALFARSRQGGRATGSPGATGLQNLRLQHREVEDLGELAARGWGAGP